MFQAKSVIVRQFPSLSDRAQCRRFYREFRAELSDVYRPQVIFDLSSVQHLTASGVDLLVRCIHQIADRDGELKLAAASPQTQLVLELTQISGVADTFDSVEDAIESWASPAYTRGARPEPLPFPQSA
jgi:anti-anti-sigma factor